MSWITICLLFCLVAPLLGAIALALSAGSDERILARITLSATGGSALSSLAAIGVWLSHRGVPFLSQELTLLSYGGYHFDLGLGLDLTSAVFLLLVQVMCGIVIRFSRVYMHREPGFRRFFAVVLMFQAGMCLLTLAANLDLLFVGWEMVGLASFLLIAFYHERPTPVRNALKTLSVYRIADIGLLAAAYLEHASDKTEIGFFLLLAAIGKSAQFPFCFWIARAMEGPTPSSALFYGALSIHAGAYLLLHTFPTWSGVTSVRIGIGAVGLVTAILCALISRTQYTVKGRVAYASAGQVGLIFVEVALGWTSLALVHLVLNALLRCYQLLVSPSAVAYLLREQSSLNGGKAKESHLLSRRLLPQRLWTTLYVFALSEGFLESGLSRLFWLPLRALGRWLARGPKAHISRWILAGAGIVAILSIRSASGWAGEMSSFGVGMVICALALFCSALALATWQSPLRSLLWLTGSGLLTSIAVMAGSDPKVLGASILYGAGIAFSCLLAWIGAAMALSGQQKIARREGLSESHRIAAAFSFLGVLGIAGFSLLPTFFGEDILLHQAFEVHSILAVTLCGLFALNGYIGMRGFSFAFFGQISQRASEPRFRT